MVPKVSVLLPSTFVSLHWWQYIQISVQGVGAVGGNKQIFLLNSVAQTGIPYFWKFSQDFSVYSTLSVFFPFILSRMFFFKEKDLNLYVFFLTIVSLLVHYLSRWLRFLSWSHLNCTNHCFTSWGSFISLCLNYQIGINVQNLSAGLLRKKPYLTHFNNKCE